MLIDCGETRMAVVQREWNHRRCVRVFLLLLFFVLPGTASSAQTIEVKLVDGRNGRPMVGASSYVNVWVGEQRKEAITIPTNEQGIARLQLTTNADEVNIPNSRKSGSVVVEHPVVKYDESLRINAPYAWCGPAGTNYSWLRLKTLTTKDVFNHGYASSNTCGKTTVSPLPGKIVLFVRPLTLWEKLKQ